MSYQSYASFLEFNERFPFASLCQPFGGLMNGVTGLRSAALGGIPMDVCNASLGAPRMAFPRMSTMVGRSDYEAPIGGAGADEQPDLARVRALAEGLERYATCVLAENEYLVASQEDLGGQALDLTKLPRCAPDEYAHPRAFMAPADPKEPIRWVLGRSLITGRELYVPAIMTHLYGRAWQSERFWLQITTGVAAHTDPIRALVGAICEVIERDAISLTWTMRLDLPRINIDEAVPTEHLEKFRLMRASNIQHHFFDATTDLGVPTVYLVQIAPGHPTVSQFVNCSTDFCGWDAAAKLIRESAAGRIFLSDGLSHPENLESFVDLSHGAAFMGKPAQRDAFDFLLKSRRSRNISEMTLDLADSPTDQLEFLIERLRANNMEAVAIDLTTDELREVGLWTMRVLIPDLVPLSSIYTARMLDHPRLYSYPEKAGFGVRTRADVNPDPQPFA